MRKLVTTLIALSVTLPLATFASSSGHERTGKFSTFSTGIERHYSITGTAKLWHSTKGHTYVQLLVNGLKPKQMYGAHLHSKACNDEAGGGHYHNEASGPANGVNEVWPTVATDSTGLGVGAAINSFKISSGPKSIVIHDTDGKRIACADLK